MLNLLCNLIEKIVLSGVDGTILIIPMGILLWIMYGQAKDFVKVARRILREGV